MQPFILELTVGLSILGAALLAYAIVRLLAAVRASVIVRLPADARAGRRRLRRTGSGRSLHRDDASRHRVRRCRLRQARCGRARSAVGADTCFARTVSGFSRVLSVRPHSTSPIRPLSAHRHRHPQGRRHVAKRARVRASVCRARWCSGCSALCFGGLSALIGGTVLTALHLAGKLCCRFARICRLPALVARGSMP